MRRALPMLVLLAAALPFAVGSAFLLNLATLAALSAALAQAWNISGGFGGLTSFGHVAFFGLGAYAAALLQLRLGWNAWLGLPVAALAGGLAGWVIGLCAFRAGLRGSYFALVTLAVAEIFRIGATSLEVTGGGSGVLLKLAPGVGNFQFTDRRLSYAASLALLALATAIVRWLMGSRFGARLVAIRENEDAARALGVGSVRVKAQALALSGALTALGGGAVCAVDFVPGSRHRVRAGSQRGDAAGGDGRRGRDGVGADPRRDRAACAGGHDADFHSHARFRADAVRGCAAADRAVAACLRWRGCRGGSADCARWTGCGLPCGKARSRR